MPEIPHAEEPQAPRFTVNLDPVAQYEEADAAMARNAIALEKQRAENERALKARQNSGDDVNASLTAKAEEVDTEAKPIDFKKAARLQANEFKKMRMGPEARRKVIEAMGIDTSKGVQYGRAFAYKVAKYQKETLGFTWDDKQARLEGRVPNGIIDDNTLYAMSKLPGSPMDFAEFTDRITRRGMELDADRKQIELFGKLNFTSDQIKAFFHLFKMEFGTVTPDELKQEVAGFQSAKLGFVPNDVWTTMSPAERQGRNVADGYFGPKSLAALKDKGIAIFSKEPDRQEALSVILGKNLIDGAV